jgi:hypothetical protein
MTTHTKIENEMNGKTAVDKAQEVAVNAQEKVSETAGIAKEQAKKAAAQVGEQAKTTVDSRMSDVAHELGSVAEAVRQTSYEIGGESQTVSRYGERLAEQLDGISTYLNEKGVEDVLTDLQDFARRQPVVFLGGAFMLGIVAGRFVRSSGGRQLGFGSDSQDRYALDYRNTADYSPTSYGTYQGQSRYRSGLEQESTTSQDES